MPVDVVSLAAMVALTIGAYALARRLYLRYQHPLVQPVFLGASLIIGVLLLSGRTFDDYREAKDLLGWFLGPVTVALAVPVYKQRARLRAAALPLACGVALGAASTIAAVLALATLAHVDDGILPALAVKSVTAPIAVELARLRGGDPSLAATFAIVTGMLGAMFGPAVLTRCQVTDPVARGIALGTASHGQGTAAALLEGEMAGAMSSLAMAVAAVFTAAIAPAYIPALLRLLAP
jgi:predicted murein hydrolase (TIGR00659 family)